MVSSASQVGPKTEQICVGPFLKDFRWIMAVIENHARKRVVHPVVDVVAAFPVAVGLADDLGHQGAGGGHHEPAGLGQDFHVRGEEPLELGVERLGQPLEGLHVLVVGRREAAADVEDLHLLVAARRRPPGKCPRPRSGPGRSSGNWCIWLPTWKLSPSTTSPAWNAASMRSTASPELAPNFDDSSTIAPVLGTLIRSTSPACGA